MITVAVGKLTSDSRSHVHIEQSFKMLTSQNTMTVTLQQNHPLIEEEMRKKTLTLGSLLAMLTYTTLRNQAK